MQNNNPTPNVTSKDSVGHTPMMAQYQRVTFQAS